MKAATLFPHREKRNIRISIHAAREGGDCRSATCRRIASLFQSTPPVKAATEREKEHPPKDGISIHAAREGGDSPKKTDPREVVLFQSTPPVKAATAVTLLAASNAAYFNPRRP